MLPVAQLYTRDVPGLPAPEGTDLLQVLWCPFDHPGDDEFMPKPALFWRSAAEVTDLRTDVPEPTEVQYDDYVPEPCTVAPERVTEYPAPLELDDELRERVEMWCIRHKTGITPSVEDHRESKYATEASWYLDELSTAPGWKVGGWIRWGLSDPYAQPCPVCATPTQPLLTIAGQEWDDASGDWIPYEDRTADAPHAARPTKVQIGRGYDQIIRVCPASPDHPHVPLMQ